MIFLRRFESEIYYYGNLDCTKIELMSDCLAGTALPLPRANHYETVQSENYENIIFP